MKVDVRAYDPAWPAAFEEIERELSAALAGVDVRRIEHVGSTSVPGLAAKPIIDVDIVVDDEAAVAAATAALAAIGYQPLGDRGVPQRYAFTAPDGGPRRHVYVTINGCLSHRNHVALRDTLRADPTLRDRYGARKLSLSTRHYDSIDGYIADKADVIRDILVAAGFSDADLAEIDATNRPADVERPAGPDEG